MRRNRLVAGEILKPGALYSDCSVIEVKLPRVATTGGQIGEGKDMAKGKGKKQGGKKEQGRLETELVDDGETGGEEVGRLVWERYEAQLKVWESKEKVEESGISGTAESVSESKDKARA